MYANNYPLLSLLPSQHFLSISYYMFFFCYRGQSMGNTAQTMGTPLCCCSIWVPNSYSYYMIIFSKSFFLILPFQKTYPDGYGLGNYEGDINLD